MKRALDADTDRKRAQEELRFVWNADNCQWDGDAVKARKGRPMLTENRNPSFIRQATNEVRRSRPQIRVLPVDSQGDPYTAQIYEGLIRNIEANSRADMSYDAAVELAGYCGRGYWKVCTEYQGDGFEQDITIEPVPDPFAIVDDPDAAYPDKSDRKFAFEIEKCPKSEYKDRYGYDPKDFEQGQQALGEHSGQWIDGDNIIIANYWRVCTESEPIYRMTDGTVTKDPQAHIAGLKAQHDLMVASMQAPQMPGMAPPMPPPLFMPPTVKDRRDLVTRRVEWYCVDGLHAHSKGEWAGQYIPLVYTTCEQMKIDGKWQTKGMTYDAQDLTRANNYLLSAQIENIALTPKVPFIGAVGQFETQKSKWNNANQEAYAYLEYDVVEGAPGPPQRPEGAKPNPEISNVRMGVIDGQRSVVGLMGASLGDQGPEQSFIAIQARQSRGDTAVFHVSDNLQRAVRYGGMVIVDLIPKIYDSARVVRIINPDGEPVMQAINQAFVTPGGETKQVDMKAGKFDITVSAGPAFETQRQSNNATLAQLVEKLPQIGQAAPDLITKALMTGPDGDKIAQRVARMIDPAVTGQAPPPAMQKLQAQVKGMQQQMHDLSTQKDFFESELAKQKGLVDAKTIENQTRVSELQTQLSKAELEVERARLDVQKKEIELEKAQLAALRASMPAPLAAPPALTQ